MESNIWGPPTWFFLHSITFNYPNNPTYKEKMKTFEFFNNLQYILPCEICRENYKKNLKELPITPFLDNKQHLISWLIKIHNMVNIELKKPIMNEIDVIKKYKNYYMKNISFCNTELQTNKKNETHIINNPKNETNILTETKNNLKKEKNIKKKIILFITIIITIIIISILIIFIFKNYKKNKFIKI
jgi:ATP-dependent Zn protease